MPTILRSRVAVLVARGLPLEAVSALGKLLPLYPDIHAELVVDNGFVDIVAERFDAGAPW